MGGLSLRLNRNGCRRGSAVATTGFCRPAITASPIATAVVTAAVAFKPIGSGRPRSGKTAAERNVRPSVGEALAAEASALSPLGCSLTNRRLVHRRSVSHVHGER
jgi:hypothetical protein